MAPALTEPLSPKEKISSSATTATASLSTRSSKKLDPSLSSVVSESILSNKSPIPTAVNSAKDKKASRSTPTPTSSTRVTRSKDTHQSGSQKFTTSTPIIIRKNHKLSNDQMGLSAARNNNSPNNTANNNNLAIKEADITNTISPSEIQTQQLEEPQESFTDKVVTFPSPDCKDNSTEQLLADLTNDFEEAITAEICLRNKLPEVELSKEAAGEATASAKSIVTIDATRSGAVGGEEVSTTDVALQHMESQLTETTEAATTQSAENVLLSDKFDDTVEEKSIFSDDAIKSSIGNQQTGDIASGGLEIPTVSSVKQINTEKPSCSRAHIVSVVELPQVGTDSTMTASEIEDNLEERLSQLDGNVIVPPVNAHDQIDSQQHGSVTPPRSSTTQEPLQAQFPLTPSMQDSMALQQQQQQLPQQQLATLTPQSTTSTLSSANLPQGFLKETTTGDELGDQDIEEVLKALKGFDGVSNTDTLGDLNIFFNDVFQTVSTYPNFEEINSQNASTSNAKPSPIKEGYADIEKKQELLTKQVDTLLRRMRKLQVRHMCKHTSLEIAGIFEWSARICNKASNPVRSTAMSEQEVAVMSVVSGRPPSDFWQEQRRNPLPSAQMSTMLRQLETVANEQQLVTTSSHPTANSVLGMGMHTKRSKKHTQQDAAATTNLTTNNTAEPKVDEVVPNYDTFVTGEMSHVAGLMHTEMREVQNAIDSDATESSSGGESADEMVNYNNQTQQPLSISKRAVWRYSRDRAAIALRWSWLTTQVNDLEVKIRQHSELFNELNRSKGEIVLESPPPPSTTSNNNNNNNNKSQEAITNSMNGYKSNVSDSESEVETTACSRTRGLKLSEFRKRKLFQTTNMHTISKKAARPSTIKCGCQWPKQPCALCTGRTDPTAPRAPPDTMMQSNRVALLDPGYHPVLSFSDDVCQSIHFESICRQPEWQYRVMRCQAKAIVKGVWKAEREAAALLPGGKRHGETIKRRYVRRKERNATTTTAGHDGKMSNASRAGGAVVTNDSGNGTASTPSTTTTTPTTPLVANKLVKRQRRSKNKSMASHENLTDQYNNYSQTNSKLISNNNSNINKSRKPSASATATAANSNYNSLNQYSHTSQLNSSSMMTSTAATATNINGDNSFLNNSNSDHWDGGIGTQRSRTASPTQGSKSGKQRHERSSRSRISYDIDNIVIPYSIAAATRVEILPYKEIPTPKWRVIDRDGNDELETTVDDEKKLDQDDTTAQASINKEEACSTQTKAKTSEVNTPAETLERKVESKDQATTVSSAETKISTKVNGALVVKAETSSEFSKTVINDDADVKPNNMLPTDATKEMTVNEKATPELLSSTENCAQKVDNVTSISETEITPKNSNTSKEDASMPKIKNNNTLINGKANQNQTDVKQEELTKLAAKAKVETQVKNETNLKLIEEKKIKPNNKCDGKIPAPNHKSKISKIDNGQKLNSVANNNKKELKENMKEPLFKKRKLENGTMENIDEACVDSGGSVNDKVGGGVAADTINSTSNSMKAPPAPQAPKDSYMPSTSVEAAVAGAVTSDAALNDDYEDTSEEVFMARHQRALIEERRKFVTYLKFPFSTRSRANRRSDSRAESSGANTPDPTSPAPHTPSIGFGDNESIPSPLALTHPHANPLDVLHEASESINAMSSASSKFQNSKRQERRRTTSLKNNKELERRSVSPEFVPPYEPLQFPLPDNVYQQMLTEMEESYKRKRIFRFNEGINTHTGSSNSRATSSARDIVGGAGSGASGKSKRPNAKTASSYNNSAEASGSGGRKSKTNNSSKRKVGGEQRLNGKILHTDADGAYGDNDDMILTELPEDLLDDVEDDDYPKHYLAPNDDVNNYFDDGADAYIGQGARVNESESDVDDPFMDDDPNDPEWKRGLGERSDQRIRRKM